MMLITFTVITPFLPTFFMAEEINSPIPLSPLAEIVATCKQIKPSYKYWISQESEEDQVLKSW